MLCGSTTLCFPQRLDFNSLLKSPSRQIVEEAVQEGLFLVESSYVLQDSTGQRFGLDRKPFFNRFDYVGIALNGGTIMPSNALSPWSNDEQFKPYRDSHTPVTFEIKMRPVKDTVFLPIEEMDYKDTVALWDGYIIARKKDMKGFILDTTSGKKEGWLVLITDENSAIQCIHKPILIDGADTQQIEVPSSLPKVYGGIYVEPVVEGIGQISFKLCGIVLPSDGGKKLNIQFPFRGNDYSEKMKPSLKGGKLQPIADTKKVKDKKELKRIKK